jgi:hypothetical protein
MSDFTLTPELALTNQIELFLSCSRQPRQVARVMPHLNGYIVVLTGHLVGDDIARYAAMFVGMRLVSESQSESHTALVMER